MANAINSLNFNSNTYTFTLPYGSCSTAAGTAAKAVTVDNFSLETGARVAVKFTVTNTAGSPTLNVNSTGAKAIYYNGAAITAGYLKANKVYEFIYNGTQWDLVGDVDTNTTYTFNGAVSTIKDSNLTASRALVSNSSGKVAVSAVTSTELGYLDGVTSNVQTQLNDKVDSSQVVSVVDYGLNGDDLDTLLNTAWHFGWYETNGATLNTPYKAGLTDCLNAKVLSSCASSNRATQVSFTNGDDIFVRTRKGSTTSSWSRVCTEAYVEELIGGIENGTY